MKFQILRRAGALVLALALALSLAVPAWASGGDDTVAVTGVTLNKTSLSLTVGGSETLTATVEPAEATNKAVTWTSDKVDVATVEDGKVTAVSPGTAIIMVTTEDGGKTATCTVTVTRPVTGVTLDKTSLSLTVGKTATLKATVKPDDATDKTVTWTSSDTAVATVSNGTVTAVSAGAATITAKAGDIEANCTVTVTKPAPQAVTGVTLNRDTLSLTVGKTATLRATVKPDDAADKTVTWTSSNEAVATVSNGTVTAVSVGEAIITAKAGDKEAKCTVTVTPVPITLQFNYSSDLVWRTGALSFMVSATGIGPEDYKNIRWSIARQAGETGTELPKFSMADGENVATGSTAAIVNPGSTPGKFVITATYYDEEGKPVAWDTVNVTISGIVLSPAKELSEDGTLKMYVNENTTIIVKVYGFAATTADVIWSSSDSSVAYMMNNQLTARNLGTAVITATKEGYSADCTVEVVEDESVIAGPYTASVSDPLNIGEVVYARLNEICQEKTKGYGTGTPYDLSYINNLTVASTDQGTLYYNYVSEGDTGTGVGSGDQFADTVRSGVLRADRLYFVPKPGFTGTAEITFKGWATSGYNFSGVIKVNVGVSSDEDGEGGDGTYQISYRTRAGEPAWFLASDFNAFCQSKTGRNYNYITFNLPKSGEGTLYCNYVAGTGNPVTTTMEFTQSGRYTIGDVCFVPNAAYEGDVTISFRAVDSSGEAVSGGTVKVTVVAANTDGDKSNVTVSGERDKPVPLLSRLFNDACRATINDTLSFVIFKLPDPSEGVLYYNYQSDGSFDSRVTAATRYYYSGVPGINGVTFVPAPGATGRIAIPYTGYGSGGTSYSGTLYINLGETDNTTIRYSVARGGSVSFKASDFNNAALYRKGMSVDYVEFTELPDDSMGTLYYDYRSSSRYEYVYANAYYHYSPEYSWQERLNLISFRAEDVIGTVTIPYTAYCDTDNDNGPQTFSGYVVIQVGAVTPEDVNISCNNRDYARLSSSSLGSVCGEVMRESLSYIEITGLPTPEEGRLYLNYSGFGKGTAVKTGDRFYYAGSPSISQLSFVPRANFAGGAEITYIGYSGNGQERVSGRIMVNVSLSRTSRYFNDMSGHTWAIDSADYLYWSGTAKGTGYGGYGPGGTVTRGDFTLMLVRAYGFTASGSASFSDVPADSYYADAIKIASLRGVVNGYNGCFYPENSLTRQDAAVIIYNALNASGKDITNGLTANLSAYRDGEDISPYAREAMGSLVQMGVLKGDGNGHLQPRRQLTRAEAAVLLHTIMTL